MMYPLRLVNRWHDELRTIHAADLDKGILCGTTGGPYNTGPYPGLSLADVTCKRCAASLARIQRPVSP